MLSIYGDETTRTCKGLNRREFLRVGGLGLGGLALTDLLSMKAQASGRGFGDKSVVFLFLVGGPPQIETFDPKPDAPENTRSCMGNVQTRMPGVRFGGNFRRLAEMTDKLAIVRSFGSGDGGHNHMPVLTGRNPLRAPVGALVARGMGPMNPRTGVPTNTVIVPESVRPDLNLGQPTGPFTYDYLVRNYIPAGNLGSNYNALMPAGGGAFMRNLELRMPRDQFENRRQLLTQIDSLRRRLDSSSEEVAGLSASQQQAYEVLLRGITEAFDLQREDPRTIARYDTSHLFRMEDYHQGGSNYRNLRNQSRVTNLLGKQMLLARRLCEAGAGCVTVVDSCWDFHGDGNNPPTPVGMGFLGPQLDHAVSAFLQDVAERRLSDKILLVVTGEMGRTPTKGRNGGTGHWGELTPLLIAGGGLRMGQVVGTTDRQGGRATSRSYRPEHLLATILQTLFNPAELRLNASALPAEVANLVLNGQPITELF